ncbi:MAG TPA: Ig-like domain repeat protein [Acidobacteriaceae bacterium]|nr:Ig-like domain repeat protein [Acidobacteriaceae bacterium]
MGKLRALRFSSTFACLVFATLAMNAQNQTSIQVFAPVNVRASAEGTGFGTSAATFNSSTLNLSCPAGAPNTAVLSSSANGAGNVLVDNDIQLTVTSSNGTTGPANVCSGGLSEMAPDGSTQQDCFTSGYQGPAGEGQLTGQDPDGLVATGGVPPIDISSSLQPGTLQLKIDLVDTGGFLANSTIYLNTSCSLSGVTGPATLTGNPIPQSNPSSQQLTQNFSFNTTTGQQIQFVFDLSQAEAAGSLSITDGTIPGASDTPLDPSTFVPVWVPGTSFATSSCMVHTGELLPNGTPACKLFTLECSVGTGSTASGAECPVSSLPNEAFQDVFDGPPFTLPDITNSAGTTFHEGIGFLMASEGWTGGPCGFDPASGLQNLLCPQNILASFSGPGDYTATGKTTHPNSTFIPVVQVPEDLTTVTVASEQPGNWINSSSASVTLSSQPPSFAGVQSPPPGAANFVAAPIQSITYGISAPGSVPVPSAPASTDTTVSNEIPCPAPSDPADPPATVFTTNPQTIGGLADGNYLLHYFAQDCAGTEELQFTEDSGGSWSTSYYTVPINVDTIAPVVASGPVLSPAPGPLGSYAIGQAVTATYSCTDERSGVVRCGASTFPYTSALLNTGSISSPVNTSTPGNETYTVTAVDAAGNQSSASVPYVVAGYDTSIRLTLSSSTVTYPLGTNVVISVAATGGYTATGTVQLYDGTTLLQTSSLGGNGAAYLYIQGLAAGIHSLTAVYSGDAHHAAGTSAPVTLTVKQVPVRLTTSCWNANAPYGENYQCGVYTSSTAGAPQGVATYQYDGGPVVSLPLQNGDAQFTITLPQTGTHTLVIGFAAQTNYAAATPSTVKFTVTKAPVVVQLTPSSWYPTGGNLILGVTIQSWSAGPPDALGTVTFYDGSTALGTVPVSATGTASITIPVSSLKNGKQTLTASYSGSANYSSGNSSAVITVAAN